MTTVQDLSDAGRRMYRGAFFLFVLAEAMIFVTLFSTRFLLAGMGHPAEVNGSLGLAVTLLLVASLAPLFAGINRIRAGRRGAGMLGVAALLGALALALIVYDWATLAIPVGSRYGENYVMSTGYHALHILLGLTGLLIVAGADSRREFNAANHWQVGAAAVFWSFVVLTWIALFAVFFIF